MDWLVIELSNGLTKLASLGLSWTPNHDVIDVTVGTWLEAVTIGREWDEARDTPRIRQAFVTLANTREAWPAPKHFLDALPRVEQRSLSYETKPLSPAECDARMAQLRRMLDEAPPLVSDKEVPRRLQTTTDTAAAERELRQHSIDRKSAAAGDA
jgi:hypothetical protein